MSLILLTILWLIRKHNICDLIKARKGMTLMKLTYRKDIILLIW